MLVNETSYKLNQEIENYDIENVTSYVDMIVPAARVSLTIDDVENIGKRIVKKGKLNNSTNRMTLS